MASQQSMDACGASRSRLSSAMWGARTHAFLHLSSSFLSSPPQKQKLKLHSHTVVARISSPALFHPTSYNPSSAFQASREKTCLEFKSPSSTSYRIAERWVCYGGGKRPRKPRIWRTRHKRGSYSKSDKLLECLESISNVKEEVYGALDAFIAWELDFPLIAVKKALYVFEQQQNWTRIIQVIKWMLGKGQGRSLGNYHLLLKAFSEEGRIDEAQELWKKVFSRNLECTPIKLFTEIMRMYNRYEMYEDLLEVFADMEELNVKLNDELADIVSTTYEKRGSMDKAEKVRQKYTNPKFRWRTVDGRVVKIRNSKDFLERGVSRWLREENSDGLRAAGDESDAYGNHLDEKVEKEGLHDFGSEHDEELQTEGEEEDFQIKGVKELNADSGHFQFRQFVKDEVYM